MNAVELLDLLERRSFTPGHQQQAINAGLEALNNILKNPEQHGVSQGYLGRAYSFLRTEHRKAQLLALHPEITDNTLLRGCEETMQRIQDAYHTTQHEILATSQHLRILVPRRTRKDEQRIKALGVHTNHFSHIPYSVIDAQDQERKQVLHALVRDGLTATIEKEYSLPRKDTRTSTLSQWNISLIGAPAAWNTTTGEDIHVGIIDTGADYEHEAIRNNFVEKKGYDFIHNHDRPLDDNGHGTHVTGTIAGDGIGVAPDATVYALKFLNENGVGYEVDFIRAAEWAIDEGLHVVNGSFGSSHASRAEEAICQALYDRGIIFAAAAGNDGDDTYNYPASYDTVISVAAVDADKERAPFSQHNDQVSLCAPGVDINSSYPGNMYQHLNGTSMATPHVAGSLALLKEIYDDPVTTRTALIEGCEPLGNRESYGAGLVRPDQSLDVRTAAKILKKWRAA